MKIQTLPIARAFKLVSDDDGVAEVFIRQATTGDTILRGELFAETSRVWDDAEFGKVELKQKWNVHEQRRLEAYMTITSVVGINDQDGNPMFRTKVTKDGERLNMSKSEFFDVWGMLPDEVTREIHGYVLDVNPHWDPNRDPDTEGE